MTRLQNKVSEIAPVFGENSFIAALEEEFLHRYPLFTRRLNFFRSTQAPGQTFSDWAGHLRRAGDEAQLSQLGTDEMYVLRYLVGTTDAKLRARFLEESETTLDGLDKMVAERSEEHTSELQSP